MSASVKFSAALAGATRKLAALAVALHCRQLAGIKKAARAQVSKAYKQADEARSAEYAAKEAYVNASSARRTAVASATTLARTVQPTIVAADAEIARYNG